MYIGIDLGTSNSVIAGIVTGEARVFRPADGGDALPSVIYIDKRGHRLYGRRAYDQALVTPENVAAGFKRLMGSSTPIEVKGAGLTLTPEECSAEIIRQLLGQAATETGSDKVTGAIITIPAAFNQMQSEATLRAAKLAGLERVDLLQEPVAAALAAMAGAKRSGQFLIYDLGGGTFDVALAQAVNGEVKIIAHQGINMLGGRDFDRMIVNEVVRPWLLANFDLPENFQRDKNYSRLIRIAQLAAEKAKIDLSVLEEASIFASDEDVRLLDQSETEIFLDAPITRARFEELIREPILQTVGLIRTLMEENNYKNDDIDRIVFIGGPSRIPFIRQLVSDELGIAADLKTDPMTAVAVGAAWYAESRQWDGASKAVVPAPTTAPVVSEPPASFIPASTPKPTQAVAATPDEPKISFDYAQRTPDDKTIITVRVAEPLNALRQLRLTTTEGWDSGILPLTDQLTIMVPLKKTGEHAFDVRVLDEAGNPLPRHDHTLTITRTVAAVSKINAAQTIAVKALAQAGAQENTLQPLVTKGMPLPAEGQAKFKAARALEAGGKGVLRFELFQVEYPERVDLNLCVGLFQIHGHDLPTGKNIAAGDPVIFDWRMSDGGILQAKVRLPNAGLELTVPRFYAPQAGQIAFDKENGAPFAQEVLKRGDEEWGDLAAAVGPQGGPEVQLLKTRLVEQHEILEEAGSDAESIRRVVEETRFIRQDIARLGKKHQGAMLQRRLGKLTAAFNRVVRAKVQPEDAAGFDGDAAHVQKIIDDGDALAFDDALRGLSDMRTRFFTLAWRNPDYVLTWYHRLAAEPWLFPDQEEFKAMAAEGQKLVAQADQEPFRILVARMLESRIALGASDVASELATLVRE